MRALRSAKVSPPKEFISALDIPSSCHDRLQKLVQKKSIAHLWLFVAPEGRVASTIARAFLLDWLEAPPGAISHPDLIEVTASGKAGLHSIAAVRRMQEQLSLSPLGSVGRAVVFDSADRMVPQTASALLKVLEEPPPSTVIVLATASPHLILPTIVSRAQTIRFPMSEKKESFIDLTSFLERFRDPQLTYTELKKLSDQLQKSLGKEIARRSDTVSSNTDETDDESEEGSSSLSQSLSKQVLEEVYLSIRDPGSTPQQAPLKARILLDALNGIDRGSEFSTILEWLVTNVRRSAF